MNNPIELQPREWTPHRKPARLSFGAVVGGLLAKLLTAAIAFAIFCCVMALGIYAKGLANQFIYDEAPKASAAPVAPGNYQWTPDKGLQKIN